MGVEIKYKKENCKTHKQMEAKQYGTEQSMDHWTKIGKQKPRYKWKWKPDDPNPIRQSKCSSKREVYNDISLPQVMQNIANNLNFHLKELEGEEQTKPKVSTRQKIIKVRAENK